MTDTLIDLSGRIDPQQERVLRDVASAAEFVISAAHKVDSQAIKDQLQIKKLRFATADELSNLTGLESGAVPPFGRPLLPFDIYLDPALLDNLRIAFNAGRLDVSVLMPAEDYLRVARPTIFLFALQDSP
jgi:Ala-tRNA(Pro) deacylase